MKRKPDGSIHTPVNCAHAEYIAARSRRAVIRYVLAFFVSALLLLLVSYFSRNRTENHELSDTHYDDSAGRSGFSEPYFGDDFQEAIFDD